MHPARTPSARKLPRTRAKEPLRIVPGYVDARAGAKFVELG